MSQQQDVTDINSPESDDFGCAITVITLRSGQSLPLLGCGSVVAVVGANNVGKSTLLREIRAFASQTSGSRVPASKIIAGVTFEWSGTDDAMREWALAHNKYDPSEARYVASDPFQRRVTCRRQTSVPGDQWKWFVNEQSPSEREKFCNPVARLDSIRERPTHPFHVLSINESARRAVQSVADKLFGQRLEIDNISGKIGLVVGDPGVAAPRVNDVSAEYADALASLPTLHEQGDGMRSALGLLIPLITDHYCISLIDEPEAFLHPPQARTLGTEVANIAARNRSQVILATHDKNFLQGLVESGAPVTIIHLTREGDETSAQLLKPEEVKQLWDDTVLRYGNALDGLFHSAVIATEGDRDSQFYAAAIDHKLGRCEPPRVHNMMFLAAHGKNNLPAIVQQLRSLGIKTVCTPDFDILDDETVLKNLVEAHGGDWSVMESDYKKATNQFQQPTQYPSLSDVKADIEAILAEATGVALTEDLAKRLRKAVSVKSPWAVLKTAGDRAFTAERSALTALLNYLDQIGIVPVRVGELERFLTTADVSKGAGFLKVAFDEGAHQADDAQKHAERLLKAAGQSEPSR